MSKISKQLASISGESVVSIRWPGDGSVDVDEVREYLRAEVDRHTHLVPVDLRDIADAPEELVNLLVESQQYARSCGKVISIIAARPPLLEALNPGRGRKTRKSANESGNEAASDASEAVMSLLKTRHGDAEYDLSKAERIQHSGSKSSRKDLVKRYRILAAVVLLSSAVIGAIEYYVIFSSESTLVVTTTKTFESSNEVILAEELTARIQTLEAFLDKNVVGWRERLPLSGQ